ncbi:MAG: septum formation initiator family protein [Nitrospirota bacterium]
MKKNKTQAPREHMASRRKRIALVLGISFLFYLALSFFLGQMGYLRYMKLRRQKDDLVSQISVLKASNSALGDKVESLKTDPDYIEQLAREQGLVKDGEIVYQYEDGK